MSRPNTIYDFFTKFDIDTSTECWNWTSAKNRKGYGQFKYDHKLHIAHRFIFSMLVEQIKEGNHILHRCDNPSCVNPEHLWQGTNQDNVDDKMQKRRHWTFRKTHCSKGHELTPENTRIRKQDNSRCCRICERVRCKKYYPTRIRLIRERRNSPRVIA